MDRLRVKGSNEPTAEFYAAATYQFSNIPGRVERFLTRLFRQRGTVDGQPVPRGPESDLDKPGTTHEGSVRRGSWPNPR